MSKELTQKQEAFCNAYIETGNASEAYRRAYSASNMSATTVNRKAKELLDNGKITARLESLREPAVRAAQVTLEGHLIKLADLRDTATAKGQYGHAIQAEIARGRAAGLYVNHSSVTVKTKPKTLDEMTDEELIALAPDNEV